MDVFFVLTRIALVLALSKTVQSLEIVQQNERFFGLLLTHTRTVLLC